MAALPTGSALKRLLDAPMRPGRVEWIGLRPERRSALVEVEEAELDPVEGFLGDHYRSRSSGSRHLTLIGMEDLSAIGAYLGRAAATPQELRRNVVTQGVNLLALRDRRFRLGSALLETTGECHPCSRMEAAFGPGGYNAVRGHGGITARVLEPGRFLIGDALRRQDAPTPAEPQA